MLTKTFNEAEALRVAVEIERGGERHYRACARVARDAELRKLLEGLAAQEAEHAVTFQAIMDKAVEQNGGVEFDYEVSALLSAIANALVFSGGVMAEFNHGAMTMESVLRSAVASEMSSILYYQEIVAASPFMPAINALNEIIAEEKKHLTELNDVLDGIIQK